MTPPGTQAADPQEYPDWRRNMHALSLGNLFSTLGFTTFFPYLPLIVRELGVGGNLETWVGYLAGGFFAVSFLLAPVWGGMADHYGRKSMVLRAGWGMGLGFGLAALAPGLGTFTLAFLLVGTCNGYVPAAVALVATNTPMRSLGRALSTVQSAALIGTTIGPALGALLIGLFPNHRHLFWVSFITSLCAGTVAFVRVRERHARPQAPFRLHLWQDMRIILNVRTMGVLFLINFIFALSFFGSTTVVALYTLEMAQGAPTVEAMGLSLTVETWMALVTLSLTVASAAALPWWGRLLDRFEPSRVLALALATGVLAIVPFPFVRDPFQLTVARVFLGLLGVGIQPAVVRLITAAAPGGMGARALALGSSLQMLGNGAAPFIAGLIGPWLGLRAYFGFNVAMVVLGLMAWVIFGVRRGGPHPVHS